MIQGGALDHVLREAPRTFAMRILLKTLEFREISFWNNKFS